MTIIETIIRIKDGITTTAVMTQGVIDDVAAYRVERDEIADTNFVARMGSKFNERDAIDFGFTIPKGTYYRR